MQCVRSSCVQSELNRLEAGMKGARKHTCCCCCCCLFVCLFVCFVVGGGGYYSINYSLIKQHFSEHWHDQEKFFFICRRTAYCGRIVYCTLLFNVLEAVQARDDNMPVPHTTRSFFLRCRRRTNRQVHGPLQSVQHHVAHRNLWHVEREGEEESGKR